MTDLRFACDVLITHTTTEGTVAAPVSGHVLEDVLSGYGWSPTAEPDRWRLPDSEGLPADWHTIGETVYSLGGIGLDVVVNSYS